METFKNIARYVMLFGILLNTAALNAQKTKNLIKKGDQLYSLYAFEYALPFYEKALEFEQENLELIDKVANCYRYTNTLKDAEKWLTDITKIKTLDPIYTFYLAQSLMSNGKYDKALVAYNTYYDAIDKPYMKENQLNGSIYKTAGQFKIKLEDFNTGFSEFSPIKINKELFFVSNRLHGVVAQKEDIWYQSPFTQIYHFDITRAISPHNSIQAYNTESNKRYQEGPIGWDRKNNLLYITKSNFTGKKANYSQDKEVNFNVFKTRYRLGNVNFKDQISENLSFDDKNFTICYPSISHKGKYMIFASDMPGGYGGLDLYAAELINGKWTNATNLGERINSPGNDAFPYIMEDGLLYFASDGHLGLGGYDIYTADLEDDGYFYNVQNLKSPINSVYDDFGIWVNDDLSKGYFSSNRPSKYGNDDIYSFESQSYIFQGEVFESKNKQAIDSVEFILRNVETKKETIVYSNQNGIVSFGVDAFTRYSLRFKKDGFSPGAINFKSEDDNVNATIPLIKDLCPFELEKAGHTNH